VPLGSIKIADFKQVSSVAVWPPAGPLSCEASALLDDSVKARAIISTIVDLAVRGYLMEDIFLVLGLLSVTFCLFNANLRRPNWAKNLAPHECDLMEHIFRIWGATLSRNPEARLPEYLAQVEPSLLRRMPANYVRNHCSCEAPRSSARYQERAAFL